MRPRACAVECADNSVTTRITIGPFRLLTDSRELTGSGVLVRLGDRAFNVLRLLAEHREEVVSKRDLLARVWPDSTVDEAALRFQIAGLRRILNASQNQVRILNAAGRGYMLTVGELPAEQDDRKAASQNLPRRDIQLIGRNEEITDVLGRLRSHRLVSLVGPGGVGKTSLALAIGHRLVGDFQCIGWIDFSSVEDASNVLLTAATTLHITPGTGDPTSSLVAHLGRESALLVFDNCEHVIEQAARLADALLAGTTTVRILATSREPLSVSSEQVYRLRPLSVPPFTTATEAAAILEYSAIELFAERARARSGYELSDADTAVVSKICRHLDGIPLAIELAACWTEAFPPHVLATELQTHLLRAEGGPWDNSARHRTLEAMLQWSYDRLKPALKSQFERLSVFRGEFDLEAAVAVAGGERGSALAGLADLVAKSLVDIRRTDEGAAYRLLFVPRGFAEERLKLGPHEREARRSHAEVILRWLKKNETASTHEPQFAAWVLKYGPIADDLRAAVEWALSQPSELELACNLAHEGALAWFRLSLPNEGARYLGDALKRLELSDACDPPLELRLRTVRGILLVFTGAATEADLPDLHTATSGAVDRVTLQLIAWAHCIRSARAGRYRRALGYAQQFETLSDLREEGDKIAAARLISASKLGLGRLEEARSGLERVVEASALGVPYSAATRFDLYQRSMSLTQFAQALWMLGDASRARETAARAVDVAESTRHGLSIAFAILWGLAEIAVLSGDADGADAALKRLTPYSAVMRPVDRGAAYGLAGASLALRGSFAEAAPLVQRCFDAGWLEIPWHFRLHGSMCEIIGRACEPQLGLRYLEAGLAKLGQPPEDNALPELLRAKATLLVLTFGSSAMAEALALLDEALSRSRTQGARAWEEKILKHRARVLELSGP